MEDDPLLTAYREAAEIYLRASDMAPDIREPFLERAWAGRELVRSSVRALFGQQSNSTSDPPPSPANHQPSSRP